MSEVYANILETLTSGLYNDVKYAVREYLQNAYDAVKQANKEGLKPSDGEFHVKVDITNNNKIITITDNGIGMDKSILDEYTSIGGGTKDSPDYAGHKGIGKLSGLRFFDEFRVKTKIAGSTTAYALQWKCGKMIKILMTEKPAMKKIPYKQFITSYYYTQIFNEQNIDEHYTQVQLINVLDEFKEQVSESRIGNYIKQNCPVPYYEEYFRHADRIKSWMDDDIGFINTYINGKVIYQFYNDEQKLVEPKLVEIKYNDQIHAKAWYSWISDTAQTISDNTIRGIRFRCKGLCVGDNNLFANNCMPRGRGQFADWFTGEIVVLDEDIKPSAARDTFYEGASLKTFFTELRNKVGKDLSLIADIRSHISAAEKEYNEIRELGKAGKAIPASSVKSLTERRKDLEKDRAKDKFGFDFGIIENLQKLLVNEEDREIEKVKTTQGELENYEDKDQITIVDKMLKLKEEQVNTFSERVKAKKQIQIDQLRNMVINQAGKEKIVDSTSDQIKQISSIIVKYLKHKALPFEESEVTEFVKYELRRR